ncbi:hypothetical protein APHAL10511_003543 [Amanita phalloides]|nr:hypothetical protein APHAL10511_003543 [Amanita phalloides]
MSTGPGITPLVAAGFFVSIFSAIIVRERLGHRPPSSLSATRIEPDTDQEKPHTTKRFSSTVEIRNEIAGLSDVERPSNVLRKKVSNGSMGHIRRFVERKENPVEEIRRRLGGLKKNGRNVGAQLKVRFATLEGEEEQSSAVSEHVNMSHLELIRLGERLGERLNEMTSFEELATKEKDAAFPSHMRMRDNSWAAITKQEMGAALVLGQSLMVTAEELKNELKKVSETYETPDRRLPVVKSSRRNLGQQPSLSFPHQHFLECTAEDVQANSPTKVDLKREVDELKKEIGIYEDKLEIMAATHRAFEQRMIKAGHEISIAAQEAEEVARLGHEKEEVVEMMRELAWAQHELYVRDAVIWELRHKVNQYANNGQTKRIEELEWPATSLRSQARGRQEQVEWESSVDTLKREAGEWKMQFGAAEKSLALRTAELATSRQETRRAVEEVRNLQSSLAGAEDKLRNSNHAMVRPEESIGRLEGTIVELKKTCKCLEKERDELRRSGTAHTEEVQQLKDQLREQRARMDEELVDLKNRNDELSRQSTAHKQQQVLIWKEESNRLMEIQALRGEVGMIRTSYDGIKEGLNAKAAQLEEAKQVLKQRDAEISELRCLLKSEEDEVQSLKSQMTELHATHNTMVSALQDDIGGIRDKGSRELEELKDYNDTLRKQLSTHEQEKFEEQRIQQLQKDEVNHLTQDVKDVSQQLADARRHIIKVEKDSGTLAAQLTGRIEESKALQNKLGEMQVLRDGLLERLRSTGRRASDEKNIQTTPLPISHVSIQAESQEIVDELEKDMRRYKNDVPSELEKDEPRSRAEERGRPESGYIIFDEHAKRQGRPLSELLEDTGLLGKALSFRHRTSLKRRKIPSHVQEAMMKFVAKGSDASSMASSI